MNLRGPDTSHQTGGCAKLALRLRVEVSGDGRAHITTDIVVPAPWRQHKQSIKQKERDRER